MEENEDKTGAETMPELDPDLRKAVLDELERFAQKGQDLLKRAKAVPKSRDLAAAMFANLAEEAHGAGKAVCRIASEVHEIEERMERAEYGTAGEDGEEEEDEG